MVVFNNRSSKLVFTNHLSNALILKRNESMNAAKAILISRPNSHHFEDRELTLEEPVKIGRAVGRLKPLEDNAAFDCKVLSRHHAVLWYENGVFYLQDTKSSNGTFVNNNRLSTEKHEVNSGDIVQFGVEVVENNRQVTHGCIIATLKLYLPDGKEAKASPSIFDDNRPGVVPLDELYKLSQVIQEASQREQCLESKLNTLQNIVEQTKRSSEESWQAYVGEERLLSRLSALEIQLQQARTNWSEDRLKEEISKLRTDHDQYQEVAKETLEKAHDENLQAVALAVEQERAKITAQQEALLARQQLEQAQLELQKMAEKWSDFQTQSFKDIEELTNRIKELEKHVEEEESKVIQLEKKNLELTLELTKKHTNVDEIQQPNFIYSNNMKTKEEILAENELETELLNKSNSNGFEQNHISLTVAPVEEKCEPEKPEEEFISNNDSISENGDLENKSDDGKKVTFNLPQMENDISSESSDISSSSTEDNLSVVAVNETDSDQIDSKTLKYQYQSAQRERYELKRKIDMLEKNSECKKSKIAELTQLLSNEREAGKQKHDENENLYERLHDLEQKWKESCNENLQLRDRINILLSNIAERENASGESQEIIQRNENGNNSKNEQQWKKIDEISFTEKNDQSKSIENSKNSDSSVETMNSSCSSFSSQNLSDLEQELIIIRAKYVESCESKVQLEKSIIKLNTELDYARDNLQNRYFFYFGPFVLLFLYIFLNSWIS